MYIIINLSSGAVSEYFDVQSLESIGYRKVRVPIPKGDYGSDDGVIGKLCAVRNENRKYDAGECDVAEIYKN